VNQTQFSHGSTSPRAQPSTCSLIQNLMGVGNFDLEADSKSESGSDVTPAFRGLRRARSDRPSESDNDDY
jgi:hypothetical protein